MKNIPKHIARGVAMALILVIVGGCATAPRRGTDRMEDIRRHIDAGNAKWIEAMRYQNPQLLASVFDSDGAMLGSAGKVYRGRDAIADAMGGAMKAWGPTETTIDTDGVWVVDDVAYETGRYTYSRKGEDGQDAVSRGRYVVRWKRQDDGTWKIATDMGLPD